MTNRILKKKCILCTERIDVVNYRDINFIKRFLTPYAKIASAKRTGNCAKHQRVVSKAIKKARILGLLPFEHD